MTASHADGEHLSSVDHIDLRSIVRLFWRRRFLVMSVVGVITVLALIKALTTTPIYTGRALVQIQTRSAKVVELNNVVPSLNVDKAAIETEVNLIRSPTVISQVIQDLGLDRDPEFRPPPFSWCDLWVDLVDVDFCAVVSSAFAEMKPDSTQVDASVATTNEPILRAVSQRLEVGSVGQSLLIAVDFDSEDPIKAAGIANTVVQTYLENQVRAKRDAAVQANDWLRERLETLRQRLIDAERAVEDYREDAGLTAAGSASTISEQQLSELNSKIVVAQAQRVEAEARLKRFRELQETSGEVGATPIVLKSPLIQELRLEEAKLLHQMAELSAQLGPLHPKIISLTDKIADLQTKIATEIGKIGEELRSQVEITRAHEWTLRNGLEKLRADVAGNRQAGVGLRELEREANASRQLYQKFLARIQETSEQQGLQDPDAILVASAEPPDRPSRPRKTLIVALAFVGSLGLAGTLVVLLEFLEGGIRSANQAERLTGYPVLALVPEVKAGASRIRKAQAALEESGFREALKALGIALTISNGHEGSKVLLVTSSLPQEGKTTLITWLAASMAQAGKTCLLVDCDQRLPQIHERFGGPLEPGLGNIVADGELQSAALRRSAIDGLDYIPAGKSSSHPTHLLASKAFKLVIDLAKSKYDLVLLDAPPSIVVADAQALAPYIDHVLYVVRWRKTKRETVLAGLKRLSEAQCPNRSLVLTRVDPKKYAEYGFGDSGVYTRPYASYYSET